MLSLEGPDGLTVDGRGNLYFSDNWNNRVRVIHPDGTIALVAGGGNPVDGLGDGGPAAQARLKLPVHLALDKTGNLFISDFLNNRVRMVRPDGVILTVAGGGNPADGVGDGGPAIQSRLEGPGGLAVDGAGNLFVADNRHFRVRKIDPTGIITTIAGTGQPGFSGDGGPATKATLNAPVGLAIDPAGNLFVADTNWLSPAGHSGALRNNRVREIFGIAAAQ